MDDVKEIMPDLKEILDNGIEDTISILACLGNPRHAIDCSEKGTSISPANSQELDVELLIKLVSQSVGSKPQRHRFYKDSGNMFVKASKSFVREFIMQPEA